MQLRLAVEQPRAPSARIALRAADRRPPATHAGTPLNPSFVFSASPLCSRRTCCAAQPAAAGVSPRRHRRARRARRPQPRDLPFERPQGPDGPHRAADAPAARGREVRGRPGCPVLRACGCRPQHSASSRRVWGRIALVASPVRPLHLWSSHDDGLELHQTTVRRETGQVSSGAANGVAENGANRAGHSGSGAQHQAAAAAAAAGAGPTQPAESLRPFAVVDEVSEDSPASEAGIQLVSGS